MLLKSQVISDFLHKYTICRVKLNYFLYSFFNVYLIFERDRERERESRGEAERARDRIQSGLQALSCQHRTEAELELMNYEIMN